jgi:tetratricopeptide (TPR) repeat protein
MRALVRFFVIAAVVTVAVPAFADTDVVVLGPAASGKVAPAVLSQVKSVLQRAGVGLAVDRNIDTACAADAACLSAAGSELSAQRVLAVTVATPSKGQILIGLSLVDVIGKEMVAVREVPVADKKLAKDLDPAIKKFLDEAPTDRAKALFAEGNQHFNLNELAQALELYKRAYRIRPLPAFLFNMAQCHRKLGNYQEAINMYQSYLVGVPDASNKDMVQSLIEESKKGLADQHARDQEKAQLAAKVEGQRLETEKTKADDARKAKEAEAVAAAEKRKAEAARMEHEKEVYDRHPYRKFTIATSILSVAAIGVGAYFGTQSKDLQQKFDSMHCGDNQQTYPLSASQYNQCKLWSSDANKDSTRATAFMIGGGAALLGSIVMFAIDPGNVSRPEAPPRAALRIAPSSVQVVLTW